MEKPEEYVHHYTFSLADTMTGITYDSQMGTIGELDYVELVVVGDLDLETLPTGAFREPPLSLLDKQQSVRALCNAAIQGNLGTVRDLVEAGVNVNAYLHRMSSLLD